MAQQFTAPQLERGRGDERKRGRKTILQISSRNKWQLNGRTSHCIAIPPNAHPFLHTQHGGSASSLALDFFACFFIFFFSCATTELSAPPSFRFFLPRRLPPPTTEEARPFLDDLDVVISPAAASNASAPPCCCTSCSLMYAKKGGGLEIRGGNEIRLMWEIHYTRCATMAAAVKNWAAHTDTRRRTSARWARRQMHEDLFV